MVYIPEILLVPGGAGDVLSGFPWAQLGCAVWCHGAGGTAWCREVPGVPHLLDGAGWCRVS